MRPLFSSQKISTLYSEEMNSSQQFLPAASFTIAGMSNPGAKFLVPDWGKSRHWHTVVVPAARLHSLAGRYDNPML